MCGERRGITAVVRAFLPLEFVFSLEAGSAPIQCGLVIRVKGMGSRRLCDYRFLGFLIAHGITGVVISTLYVSSNNAS